LLADQVQQVGVKVEIADRDQINDYHRDALPQQGGTLGRELPAAFGTIFVGGADEFDSGDQPPAALRVVHADLVLVGMRTQMHAWCSDVTSRECPSEVLHDDHRPAANVTLPMKKSC